MTRIPEATRMTAYEVASIAGHALTSWQIAHMSEHIALALMAERERCVAIAEMYIRQSSAYSAQGIATAIREAL